MEILGFPCNQFGRQEPGTNAEIIEFVKTYNVSFPLFDKIRVNGPTAHPLWKWLKASIPGLLGIKGVKWNFEKFMLNRQGKPVKRFSTATAPNSMEDDIIALLGEE